MKNASPSSLLLAAGVLATAPAAVVSGDAYHVKRLGDLTLVDGKLPAGERTPGYERYTWQKTYAMHAYAVLNGPGEVYVQTPPPEWNAPFGAYEDAVIAIRAQDGGPVRGRLFVPKQDLSGMVALEFTLAGDTGRAQDKGGFLQARLAHYQRLLDRDIPGAAWFRHQVRLTTEALDLADPGARPAEQRFLTPWQRESAMVDTYALVSGGRAMSENLQLDRVLPTTKQGEATIPVDSIEGITIRDFDWTALIDNLEPSPDPLASLIPDDQHALFFPTFQALIDLADEADAHGAPVLEALQPRAEHAQTRARYERQLCLPMSALARLLGPHLVNSVAVTGADPYLRTGADVAILFEARNLATLKTAVLGRVGLAAGAHPEAAPVSGRIDGVSYSGMHSPDRTICAYVAAVDNAVVVTNSLAQLRRLVDVSTGVRASLVSSPEYTFFRDRYPRGDDRETALLVLSDNTIRRWCGPRWRIGTSRRTRAAAAMTEIQAAYLDRLVRGDAPTGPIHAEHPRPDEGELMLTPAGITSSVYGTLDFQTPILELDLAHATKAEADLYRRWRDGYQRNWRNYFDPIAVRFALGSNTLGVDVTVMPLIVGSDYRLLVDLSNGASIARDAGDPHPGSLLHLALAINKDSSTAQMGAGWARTMATTVAPDVKLDPLGWLGESIALYADDDPFWAELAGADDPETFMEGAYHRLPVALHAEVTSGLKLTAFLATFRAFIDQTAPGMTVWETGTYNDFAYVKITPSELAKSEEDDELEDIAIYYAASGDDLIVTLDEGVLKRALDRQAARRRARADGRPIERPGRPWLGDNFCLQADRKIIHLIEVAYGEDYQQMLQLLAWRNLAILNEWKRRYPERDPVGLHAALWQRRLICPGGGAYRWNETWQTMESTVYGHPGEPRSRASLPPVITNVRAINAGLTFEGDGLRARVVLGQEASPPRAAGAEVEERISD
ncbi:MAG: hypothetical protein ACYS0G_06895 [Planctomycetota bacterium]|jgi:hypothetical protein